MNSSSLGYQKHGTENKRRRPDDGAGFYESAKRARGAESVPSTPSGNEYSDDIPQSPSAYSPSPSLAGQEGFPSYDQLQYMEVHQVTCTHHNHEQAMYRDPPRLFQGDSRVTPLHGRFKITQDVFSEDFAAENPLLAFLVIKEYNCGEYFEKEVSRDAFKTIEMPDRMAKALAKFKPQLSFLEKDGPEASYSSQRIFPIAYELKVVLRYLRSSYSQYFGGDAESDEAVFSWPYLGIYHTRHMTDDILNPAEAFNHVDVSFASHLINYIKTSNEKEFQDADAQFASGLVTRQHFSKLFAPEDVLVRKTEHGPVGCILSQVSDIHENSVELECWNWGFDGRFFKEKANWTVEWPSGGDRISLDLLELYPLKFDKNGLREKMFTRGDMFWKCRSRQLVECDSLTTRFEFQTTCNRYMIDMHTYRQMHPDSIEEHEEKETLPADIDSPPNEDFLLLLPPTIRGYGFHDKKWSRLPIDSLRQVKWNSDTFDRRLVLKPTKKELVKALITVHNMSTVKQQKSDIIEGKGKGLIILLHGGPGTGKTLTAESIAEFAKCPLYRVTCGDIGTDPESVEKYLESVLYIGTVWRCVVLLDEADVFLEERTPTDLQRNALVSVFLRTLEYFEGILVLTSNRVGTFDEAFKSRVQLAIHYPPLDVKGRFEIWRMFFVDMLGSDEKTRHEELHDKLDILARHEMNGRQIRNVINTARQLARYRKEVLAFSHIDQALEVAQEFERYVTETRGHTDEQYARLEGFRK